MKTILALIDFSEVAKNAARYACHLASLVEGELKLLHAFPITLPIPVKPKIKVYLEEIRKEKEEAMRQLAKELHKICTVSIQYEIMEGFMGVEINKMIAKHEVDLVVMGIKKEEQLTSEIFGGSVAFILSWVTAPVLVLQEGARFRNIEAIVFATDFFNMEDPMYLKPVREMAEIFNAGIQIVHVVKKNQVIEPNFPLAKLEMDRYFYPTPCTYHFEENDDVLKGIKKFTRQKDVGMLALVSHQHSLWEKLLKGTHTGKFLQTANIPLLIMHER